MESLKDELIRKNKGKCRHWTGVLNKLCAVGVRYSDLLAVGALPCYVHTLRRGERTAPCAELKRMTHDEAIAKANRVIDSTARVLAASAKVCEDADGRGLGEGHGGEGKIACPCCEVGMIRYSVAGVNGHIMARCSTVDCVRFIQ